MTAPIRRAIHRVLHPGPRPAGWAGLAALTLTAVGIALVVLIATGAVAGRPAQHFGESRAGTFLSAALLLIAAALCGAIVVDRHGHAPRGFWTVAVGGFLVLAYDELGMGHENLNKHLHLALGWDRTHWLTNRFDDLIVLVYGLVALWWAFRYRHHLLRLRWATTMMTIAGIGFIVTVVADLARGWPTTEETAKILAEAFIVVALLAARVESRAL